MLTTYPISLAQGREEFKCLMVKIMPIENRSKDVPSSFSVREVNCVQIQEILTHFRRFSNTFSFLLSPIKLFFFPPSTFYSFPSFFLSCVVLHQLQALSPLEAVPILYLGLSMNDTRDIQHM